MQKRPPLLPHPPLHRRPAPCTPSRRPHMLSFTQLPHNPLTCAPRSPVATMIPSAACTMASYSADRPPPPPPPTHPRATNRRNFIPVAKNTRVHTHIQHPKEASLLTCAPRSPRATMMPSAACTMASSDCRQSYASSLAINSIWWPNPGGDNGWGRQGVCHVNVGMVVLQGRCCHVDTKRLWRTHRWTQHGTQSQPEKSDVRLSKYLRSLPPVPYVFSLLLLQGCHAC